MAKYTGVSQNPDGSWSYRIKKKVKGKTIDTKIKKDDNGMPFTTARACYEAKLRYEAKLSTGEIKIAPVPSKTALQSIYDSYMVSSEAKQKAPATIRKQVSMWKNHVGPAFGETDINTIKITDLNDFLYNMYQTHSYAYTESFLKFFYLLFGYAYRLELFDHEKYFRMFGDSGTRLSMPVKEQADVEEDEEGAETYRDDQLLGIENVFKSEDGNLLTAFYLGLYCGLRISECFALRWSNVNWKEKTITVNRQQHNVGGQITLSKVKTMTAIRTVLMPSFLQDYLDDLYEQQRYERLRAKEHYKDTERVYDEVTKEWIVGGDFINRKHNGELLTVNSMKYWAKKIKEEEKIDFRYHNLRHTYATNCALNNINMLILMEMLGHKKLETTKKYYINLDQKKYKKKIISTLDGMYDFRDKIYLDPRVEKDNDIIETIDSKGRKTGYMILKRISDSEKKQT